MEDVVNLLSGYRSSGRMIKVYEAECFELRCKFKDECNVVIAQLCRYIEEEKRKQRCIIELISKVKDSREREVLTARYIDGLTVEWIAERMFYSDRWVKKLHERALHSVCEILSRESGKKS